MEYYIIEYYSAIKKKGILSFVAMWMTLEAIMLRNNPSTKRYILLVLTYMWELKKWIMI